MNITNKSIYGELNYMPHWYALHTKFRHEKKVAQRLAQKGIENYLPLRTMYRKWSDRYKKVDEPLFSCYVFVNIPLCDRIDVLQTDGAVKLVSFRSIPAVIPEMQIHAVKQILEKRGALTKEKNLEEVQKKRMVKETTIILNLQHFNKDNKGKYTL